MSQYYVPANLEKYVKWHIPFTPYFLYRYDKVWRIVEKELSNSNTYHYRFL